jgi:aminoglycoside phosphotransferase family enzyme
MCTRSDFLDFHDLKQRKFYCEEEIRLNQPWAPDIYLDVVPITIVDDHPRFNGDGTAIEYAVRMRRFDAGLRLDTQLERGLLSVADMKELGRNIAARHTAAPAVDANQRDRVVSLTKSFIRDNFAALDGFIDSTELDKLRRWTEAELQTLEPELWRRSTSAIATAICTWPTWCAWRTVSRHSIASNSMQTSVRLTSSVISRS